MYTPCCVVSDVIMHVFAERTSAAAAAVPPGVARVARRRRETIEAEAGETKQGTYVAMRAILVNLRTANVAGN